MSTATITWIPCSERLPDSNRGVLLHIHDYDPMTNMVVGFCEQDAWFDLEGYGLDGSLAPTHWAELPEPPNTTP